MPDRVLGDAVLGAEVAGVGQPRAGRVVPGPDPLLQVQGELLVAEPGRVVRLERRNGFTRHTLKLKLRPRCA